MYVLNDYSYIITSLIEIYDKHFNKPQFFSLITTASEDVKNDLKINTDLRFKKTQLLKIKELQLPMKALFSLYNYNIGYVILTMHVKIYQDQILRACYISDILKQTVNDEIIEVNQFLHYKKVENIPSLESILNDRQEIANKILSIELSMDQVNKVSPGIYDVYIYIYNLYIILEFEKARICKTM